MTIWWYLSENCLIIWGLIMAEIVKSELLENVVGVIEEINGPIAIVKEVRNLKMMEVVKVSKHLLIGEVISLSGDKAVIQIYENTSGVRPGDYVYGTGEPYLLN